MAKVVPLNRTAIVKKRTKKFKRYHSAKYMRVPESWRTPHGIDSFFRRCFRGTGVQPGIGYGSNKKTRYTLKNGLKKFRVFNVGDLDMLLMHNRTYCAEIAHNVSARNRKEIVQRAQQLNVVLINANGKLRAEESE